MNLGTILRIASILLGIASAVLLAHSGFGMRVNEDFLLFLDVVRDAVGFVVLPFELLIVNPADHWLHEQGFEFQLHPHWKHTFVLSWLYYGAFARAAWVMRWLSPPQSSMGATQVWIDSAFDWIAGFTCAITGGVLAGTVPLSTPLVFVWPLVAYALYRPVREVSALIALQLSRLASLIDGHYEAMTLHTGPATFLQQLSLAILAAVVGFGLVRSSSPGLVSLIAFIGGVAVLYLRWGGAFNRNWWRNLNREPQCRVGLDILSVLGGAAIIVYLAHLMA